MFSERLDFLMNLTNVNNSALAKAISFDPSYISKIRSGKRKLPRNNDFFERCIPYFAKNLNSDYQRKAMSDTMLGGHALPEDREKLEKVLDSWLRGARQSDNDTIRILLQGATNLSSASLAPFSSAEQILTSTPPADITPTSSWVYYGNEGKRQAVETFLTQLSDTGKAFNLLLFSDEDMTWLSEKPAFTKLWGQLLKRLLSLGSNIKIIHSTRRNSSELMSAVQGWLPLYLSGRVEPYYCTRLRDNIFRRSLFVAQGHSVLLSNSITESTEEMATLRFDDPDVIKAFEAEFWNYFSLCRPLMRIYKDSQDVEILQQDIRRLDAAPGPQYMAQSLPAISTMPQSLLADITKKLPREERASLQMLRDFSANALLSRLESGSRVFVLMNLPNPKKTTNVSLPLWPLLKHPDFTYNSSQLAMHLNAEVELMEQYSNYRVIISDAIDPSLMIMASDNNGAALTCPLPAVFVMEEENISSALREYLQRQVESTKRKNDIPAMQKYIRSLK